MPILQIGIFEPLNTAERKNFTGNALLWFASKLVSLNHWIQPPNCVSGRTPVVICFQISIFEPLNTALLSLSSNNSKLWFAFKLVSLNHWIQLYPHWINSPLVVICFQISIFEPLNTAEHQHQSQVQPLWFAFKLVSLNHWIQPEPISLVIPLSCDLLSN